MASLQTYPIFCWVRDTDCIIHARGEISREIVNSPVLAVLIYLSAYNVLQAVYLGVGYD